MTNKFNYKYFDKNLVGLKSGLTRITLKVVILLFCIVARGLITTTNSQNIIFKLI